MHEIHMAFVLEKMITDVVGSAVVVVGSTVVVVGSAV